MKRILSGAAGLALLVFTIGFVASAAQAETFTQPVGDAGTVTFSTDGGVLAFVGAEAADGWTYTIDRQDDTHLEVTFRDANGAEVEFEAELEDGTLDLEGSDEAGGSTTIGDTTDITIDDSDDEFDDDSDDEFDDEFDDESDDDSDEDSDDDSDEDSDDDSDEESDDDSDEDNDSDSDDEDEDEDEDGTTTTTVVSIP